MRADSHFKPPDPRRYVPAAERNRIPIANALAAWLPSSGLVLEVASGTGQHVACFACRFPALTWQPTDVSAELFDSVRAHVRHAGAWNVAEPLVLDVCGPAWPAVTPDAVFAANLTHIAPERVTYALVAGAAAVLASRGRLVIYGPFRVEGRHTSAGNAAFDADLRRRNPDWGLRDVADVERWAADAGFVPLAREPMPANNLLVVFQRSDC